MTRTIDKIQNNIIVFGLLKVGSVKCIFTAVALIKSMQKVFKNDSNVDPRLVFIVLQRLLLPTTF